MPCAKAVIFDYVGTLVNCKSYTMEASREKLRKALVKEGFGVAETEFKAAYTTSHEKYRKVRYEELKEVTNAIWVAEALNELGFRVTSEDQRVKSALNVFFQDFLDTLELRADAKKLIKKAKKQCKVGLISNFTYAPVIYASLRKLGIDKLFDVIVVSEENGWRKPSTHIFQNALGKLQVKAQEAVYIGDSPTEDMRGAEKAGLVTVFVQSQFNSLKDLLESQEKPSYIANDLLSISNNFLEITGLKEISARAVAKHGSARNKHKTKKDKKIKEN